MAAASKLLSLALVSILVVQPPRMVLIRIPEMFHKELDRVRLVGLGQRKSVILNIFACRLRPVITWVPSSVG